MSNFRFNQADAMRQRFLSEAVLTSHFRSLLRDTTVHHPAGFLTEFDCGAGIADFVLYKLHDDFKRRATIGKILPKYVYALRELPYRINFSEIAFSRRLLASRDRTRLILNAFADLGYCKKGMRKSIWKKIRQPQPVVTHICSVEAKLTDWRQAIRQAYRYLEFSHQAWVLLDRHSLRPALMHLELFRQFNIGLAAISPHSTFELHFAPAITHPRNPLRYWQANAQIAATILDYGQLS